jgi:tetratricopeptide (TPR) repeat protein
MMTWRCKATALMQLGNLDEAKPYFDRVLTLLPDDEAAILGKAQLEAARKHGILQGLAQAGYELLLALALSG